MFGLRAGDRSKRINKRSDRWQQAIPYPTRSEVPRYVEFRMIVQMPAEEGLCLTAMPLHWGRYIVGGSRELLGSRMVSTRRYLPQVPSFQSM